MSNKERIELHCHSKCGGKSALYPGEIISYLSEMGLPGVAITDESVISAYPEIESVWDTGSYSARPIYGMEMIVAGENGTHYNISVLIKNEAGKKALYRMISENTDESAHPVFDLDNVLNNRENLLIGSGTENGLVCRLAISNASDEELSAAISQYDYVEVLPFSEYETVNKRLINLCDRLGILVVAVSDARYADKLGRTALDVLSHWNNEARSSRDYSFKSTEDMLASFSYLSPEKAREIVVDNTHKIADMCECITTYPKERCYPVIAEAGTKLRELCRNAFEEKYHGDDAAKARTEWELDAITKTDMDSYVLTVKLLLDISGLTASDISIRGLAPGSIVLYLLGISEVDPIKYGIHPEIIFGTDGTREIDIDINVDPARQKEVQNNLEKLEGIGKAVCASVISQLTNNMADEIVEHYMLENDSFFEEEIKNKLVWKIAGNYRIFGKHPGGMVVFPKGCEYKEAIPIIRLHGGLEGTGFNYYCIDRAFTKHDILTHKPMRMLHALSEKTGVNIEAVPIGEKEVLELFEVDESGQSRSFDLPGIDYKAFRSILATLQPKTFDDLVKALSITYGTGTWDGNASTLISEKGLGINDIIASRDDVFDYALSLGIDRETAYRITEIVRKGMASNGRHAKWLNLKKVLVEAGATDWFIWSCEQIRYLFPKANAVSYLNVVLRLGWFKVYYPDEYASVLKEYIEDCL